MKKILLTWMAVTAMLSVAAQTDTTLRRIDTVEFPLNLPTYFQNDWTSGRDRYEFTTYELFDWASRLEIRRYDIPGDSLKLVGLAGVFGIADLSMPGAGPYIDPSIEGRLPEYLQLYECAPDTIHLIKQMAWTDVEPRCRISLWNEGRHHRYPGLYEVYFEDPITVQDSFYVSGTENNDQMTDSATRHKLYLETIKYKVRPRNKTDSITMRVRMTHDDSYCGDSLHWLGWKTLDEYMLFPIIDTTGMTPPDPDTNQGGDTTIVDTNVVDTTKISRLADQFSQIYPNPATDNAVVFSSIPMRSVALYDPTGRCVLRRRVDGTTVQLDLKGIARGQCLVVINTPAGRALKRLLLQ